MDLSYHLHLDEITEGHVFYRFHNEEAYINNLISFIKNGLERKQLERLHLSGQKN